MTIGIVGLGLIGGSVGLALRQAGHRTVGFDRRAEAADSALSLGCVERTVSDLDEVTEADVVFLASPPTAICQALLNWPIEPDQAVVTDVAGLKRAVIEACPSRLASRFVAGHPMAGDARSGPLYARADLFHGATWVLCPTPSTRPDATEQVTRLVCDLGAKVLYMDAESHDRHISILSHLPHVLASALLWSAQELEHPEVTAGSWRDLTRVGHADPDLWADILLLNRDLVQQTLLQFSDRLATFRRALESGDRAAVRAAFAGEMSQDQGSE